jgi:lipopolysaccharide export system protein LptA
MEAQGHAPEGLTFARFSGHVQFDERGADLSRTARSQMLETSMGSGLGTIDEANFSRGVHFDEARMSASASAARYLPGESVLELRGSEPGFLAPHLRNDRLDLGATRIDVVLDGPRITATGKVASTLRPQTAAASGDTTKPGPERKAPSMLKSDQDVQVTADQLVYDSQASSAVYSGSASLWQTDTKIRGASIAIDDETGNLTADGGVTTTAMVFQTKDGQKARVLSRATARNLHYEESLRRATYAGDAHLTDPQGDLKASTIALYLKPSGDEIERIEARQRVQITVFETRRVATGDELTYFSVDERYDVRGAPVTILDECGRKNEGLTLTFFRAVDRIILGGGPQNLTRTRSDGASCR